MTQSAASGSHDGFGQPADLFGLHPPGLPVQWDVGVLPRQPHEGAAGEGVTELLGGEHPPKPSPAPTADT